MIVPAPVTLVTAIYARQPDDELGGRGRPVAFYLDSLSRLSHLRAPWVIYTDARHVEEISAFCRSLDVQVDIVARPLDLVPHAARITDLRERLGVRFKPFRDRCHMLCFAKVGWLAAEAASPRFGSDFVYWIDAGLAHEGLFPRRLFTAPERIFHPRVLSSLQSRGMTLLGHPMLGAMQHDVSLETMAGIAGLTRPPTMHVVGGLFGGRRQDVMQMALEFERLHVAMLDAGLLGTEENVLSLVAACRPEWPLVEFETWYHEETDFVTVPPGTLSFHVLFERWAELIDEPVVTPPARAAEPQILEWPFQDAFERTPTSSS